ncbi:hypothetical protein AWN76_009250 [Rhodothermaceae bacterium RA]|nr:hypothetical protein AWN76_009250 [Rhodothermaceae bacterium RA]
MTSPWLVRPAAPAEAEVVAAFLRAALPAPLRPYTIYASDRLAAYVADGLASPTTDAPRFRLLTTTDGTPAGLAEWRTQPDGLFLNQLVVAPRHRRRGGARALLAHALSAAGTEGMLRLDVFANRPHVLDWYRRLGLAPEATRTWTCLPLPCPSDVTRPTPPPDLHEADARHRRYGFSTFRLELEGRTYTIGRLGSRLFRTTDAAVPADREALLALAHLDPRRRLLCIAPGPLPGAVLARSLRLAAPVAAVRAALTASPTPSGPRCPAP